MSMCWAGGASCSGSGKPGGGAARVALSEDLPAIRRLMRRYSRRRPKPRLCILEGDVPTFGLLDQRTMIHHPAFWDADRTRFHERVDAVMAAIKGEVRNAS